MAQPMTPGAGPDRHSPTLHMVKVQAFVRDDLPFLNAYLEAGAITFVEWMRAVLAVIDGIEQTAEALHPAGRDVLFMALSFIGASAEHHAQVVDKLAPGAILRAMPGVEVALLTAGGHDTVGWMTAYTFWLTNNSPVMAFTRAPWHRVFHDDVRVQTQAHEDLNDTLVAFADGNYTFDSHAGVIMMSMTAGVAQKTQQAYHGMTHSISGRQFRELRNWLVSTVINGMPVKGANAAWIYAMSRTDLLLGTATDAYVEHAIRPASKYFSRSDAAVFAREDGRNSVYDIAADVLGFGDADQLSVTPIADVVSKISTVDAHTRVTLEALTATWRNLVAASNAHYAQIERCLVRDEIGEDELDNMPVKPTEGTGGNGLDQVRGIVDMRKNYMPARKVADALAATSTIGTAAAAKKIPGAYQASK